MAGLRVMKVLTLCALLVLMATAWVFRFDAHGYNETLGSLRRSFGDGAYIFIAIFSAASLVSVPIFAIVGVIGVIVSRRLGRAALVWALLCCAFTAGNLMLWKKYGGVPTHDSGITPVNSRASQSPPAHRAGKVPQP